MKPIQLKASGLSDIGIVRDENQDALYLPETLAPTVSETHGYLYALADGMGGHASGSLASQVALTAFVQTFYAGQPHQITQNLRAAVAAANLEVHRATQRLNTGRMGSTLTAFVITPNRLYLAHVGDTRIYLVRHNTAFCLTHDHSQVGELVRLNVLAPHQVRHHPRRSILSKSIGIELFVQPDIAEFDLQADDRLILCCDGVWAVIEDHEFAQLAGKMTDADELSQQLIRLALERESDDNVSAIVVHVQQLAEQPQQERVERRWWHKLFPWPTTRVEARINALSPELETSLTA